MFIRAADLTLAAGLLQCLDIPYLLQFVIDFSGGVFDLSTVSPSPDCVPPTAPIRWRREQKILGSKSLPGYEHSAIAELDISQLHFREC